MLKQARYFQAVVRCGSFSKAAEECFISQSAISQQVQALEKELGVKLLHREGRRFSLTPAGELFYQKSLALTVEWDKLCREVCQVDNEGKAHLRVGCLRSFAGSEFLWTVQSFAERYPSVELHLTTGSHEDLYELLISRQVDFLLSDQRRAFSEGYYNEILAARPYQAELAARHPIAQRDSVAVEELNELPCILVTSMEQRHTEQEYYRDIIGLHPPKEGWNMENVKATFEEQLQKLGVDYVDFYLLHGIMESDIYLYTDPAVPLADYFYQQKQAGKIRHFGFSSHGKPETLKKVLEWKEYFEFCQIQLNYLDWTLQDAKTQYDILVQRGLPVIVMEPVRGGRLAALSGELEAQMQEQRPGDSVASWAFRFLKGLPDVKVVLSGMTYPDQLEDNLKTFADDSPLSESQQQFLFDSVVPTLLDAVPCTACRYCCEGCPKGLDIPTLVSIYNEMNFSGRSFRLNGLKEEELPKNCVCCGKCMKVCPQGINIPDVLKKMAEKIAAQ